MILVVYDENPVLNVIMLQTMARNTLVLALQYPVVREKSFLPFAGLL